METVGSLKHTIEVFAQHLKIGDRAEHSADKLVTVRFSLESNSPTEANES